MDILYDIFGVHKALVFGRLQREDYSAAEFMKNLKTAEKKKFGDDICSQYVSEKDPRFMLSFYPEYLINDDVFEVMACHFAVSSVVRSMSEKLDIAEDLHICSVVVPVAVCSRYDVDVPYQPTITNIDNFVNGVTTSDFSVIRSITPDITNIMDIAETLQMLISHLNASNANDKVIVIVFNRQKETDYDGTKISIFGCDEALKLQKFHQNHFISLDFHVYKAQNKLPDESGRVTCCWMNFGLGQRLRFYPEYAVWIIPHLFVRSTKMTAHQFLERIYDDHYKHGWRVSLDDPVFNKYYHIITQHEHISNNYNRNEVDEKQKGVQRLLRDYLDEKMRLKSAKTLSNHVIEQAHDSESILEDMEDAKTSNIIRSSGLDAGDIRSLRFSVLKFQNMDCKEASPHELVDCEHVEILIKNLRKLQDCDLAVDALNVVQFDIESVISSFDHIIKVHGFLNDDAVKLEKIQHFVTDRITCSDGANCQILKSHSERTRERQNVEEKIDEPVHEVDTLCEVTADTLHSIHCYLLHHDAHLYRLKSGRENDAGSRFATAVAEEERKDAADVQVDGAEAFARSKGINFGLNVLQWLQYGDDPHFGTLGEEMVNNPESTIDAHIFEQYLMICLAKIKETNFSLNEMICLKFYTDTNEMQSQLRKAHWTAALLKVRKVYYQWAMGLYRAHLYHDAPIPTASGSTTKPCRLYHGLNQLFTVSSEMPVYFGPFSTTIARTVASTFCDEKGLIWLIQSSYVNPLKIVVGINVDWISGFKHEREVLLYNQCLPIQETETFDDNSDILMNHFIRSLISRESPIIKKDAFYKQLGVGLDAKWMRTICDHELVFAKTECNDMRVVDRLVTELGVVEPDLVIKLWNTKRDDKTELEYFVDDLETTQLMDHCRVLKTKFKILHFNPFLNRTWLQFTGDANDGCFKNSIYKTNGQSFVTTTSSVKGQVTKIQVKNSEFFGNRLVKIQTFANEEEHKDATDDFVDSLSVDRYGFVFVDDIPKNDHQFAIDDEVRYDNGPIGKVCDLAVDRICIEVNGGDKRWIEKKNIPMTVTLCFPHQQDIGEYDFMVLDSKHVDPPNGSEATYFSFAEVGSFAIPCPAIKNDENDAISLRIYAKPKDNNFPPVKIKCIEYKRDDASAYVAASSIPTTDVESIVNLLLVSLKERDQEISNSVGFLNSVGLQLDEQSEWMDYITVHALLFDMTFYRRKLVIERLIVELNLWSTEWVHRILEQTKKDQPMLEWLVEDRKMSMLLDHYRVMNSKFEILHFSPLLNRSWLRFTGTDNGDFFKEIEYQINGQSLSVASTSVRGLVTRIEVKNSKLFGIRPAHLQAFENKEDDQSTSEHFIDSLTVDQYDSGIVFVNDIPSKAHQFAVGDEVRCEDNSIGKICDLTATKICIEIGDERRWIERSNVPMTVSLIFPHQQDIRKYEFVVTAAVDNDAANHSDERPYSFSDIERFEIPLPSLTNKQQEATSFGVYAKPKGAKVPLIKLKSIEHPQNLVDVAETPKNSISETDHESAVNNFMMALKERDTEIRDRGSFLGAFGLHLGDNSEWMRYITDDSRFFEVTAYRRKLVVERLLVEMHLLSPDLAHRIVKQTNGSENKTMLEWLVEDRGMFLLADRLKIMQSKFEILHYSPLLNRSWLHFVGNSNDDDIKETEYQINDQIIVSTAPTVRGKVTRVEVKNTKLFGDRFVHLQSLEDGQDRQGTTNSAFVNSLTVDQYDPEILFVNNIPKKDHQFAIGDGVRCEDDSVGKICDLTVDQICIEIGDERRWIERSTVPITVSLIFPAQHEIGKYEFVISGEAGNEPPKLSELQQFSFADVGRFEIPLQSIMSKEHGIMSFDVYAKPKGTALPLINIKSIEYPHTPKGVDKSVIPTVAVSKMEMQSVVNQMMTNLIGGDFEIVENVAFLNSLGLYLDEQSEWMQYITEHSMLFDITLYRRKLVIERLIVELKLFSTEWVHRILEKEIKGKSMLEWLVEDRKMNKLSDHLKMMKCKFKILHFSPLLNRSWLRLETSNKEQTKTRRDSVIQLERGHRRRKSIQLERGHRRRESVIFLDEIVADKKLSNDDDFVKESVYEVNGELFDTTTFSVMGQVTNIKVKNTKLFGSRFATLQTFESGDERKEATCAFIDCLSVDQYDFVFVDTIPRRDHNFEIGDNVKCKDGSFAKICDLTADRICIEVGDETRWTERIDIPMTLNLTFPHRQDIGKYAFVLCTEMENVAANLTGAKQYSFSDIDQFEIPYPSLSNHHSDAVSVGLYVKLKDIDVPLAKIKNIGQTADDVDNPISSNTKTVINQLIGTLKQTPTEIRNEKAFLNLFGLDFEDRSRWMHLIIDHPLLFDDASYRKKLVIERLIVELKLLDFQWIHTMLKQKKDEKSLLQWLVEDRKLSRLFPHYKAFFSRFTVCHHSFLMNGFWLKFEQSTKMDAVFGFAASDESKYDETEYEINGTVYSEESTPFISENVGQVMRNKSLFGDTEVPIEHNDTKLVTNQLDGSHEVKNFDVTAWFDDLTRNKREEHVQLTVCNHRGHDIQRRAHPKSLLENGTGSYYFSTNDQGPASTDWIIFKIKGEKGVIPTKVVIRNDNSDQRAIKCISIHGSTDNRHFMKWCQIDNIQKVWRRLLVFTIDPMSAYFAFTRGFTYFRLNILENYGAKFNAFCEFGILGLCADRIAVDFIDTLNVDQYGCVFVDDSPSETYSFKMNQDVQSNDGWVGTICRLTSSKICVKGGSDGIHEFRWFERVDAPTEITLIMYCKEDLGNYHFAAEVKQHEKPIDLSKMNQRSFTQIQTFMLPLPAMVLGKASEFVINVYVKPKGSNWDWTRIKTLDYSSYLNNNGDELILPSLERLFATLKDEKSEIKSSVSIINEFGLHSMSIKMWSEITIHPDLFHVTAYRRRLVIERLIVEVFKTSKECIHWILDQEKDDKPLLQWLVEDRKLYRLFPHYRVMMSGFKVVHKSTLLNVSWLKFNRYTKMYSIFGGRSTDDSYLEEAEYTLDGVVHPQDASFSCTQLPSQHVRCASLFGDISIPVKCTDVESHGQRDSILIPVVYGSKMENMNLWIQKVAQQRKEVHIELKVDSHRGHYNEYHIEKVLQGGSYLYWSYNCGSPSQDWFIFSQESKRRFIPKRVMIRNYGKNNQDKHINGSLKSISIEGKGDDDEQFTEWIRIDNIRKGGDTVQTFPVEAASSFIAWKRGFHVFRVKVLENHGKPYNIFRQFKIYGVYHDVADVSVQFADTLNVDQHQDIVPRVNICEDDAVKIHQNGYPFAGTVCRVTEEHFCAKVYSGNMSHFRWFKKCEPKAFDILEKDKISEYIFAARAGSTSDGDDKKNLEEFTFKTVDEFVIPTDLLLADSNTVTAVHIYAKPRWSGTVVDFHRIKTVEYQFKPWVFSRYFIDQKYPICIEDVCKVNPFSELLQRGGHFQVMTTTKIVLSDCGEINADECGLEINSKFANGSSQRFGGYVGDLKNKDVAGSGGGIISLFAGDGVVNRGTLSCKGTESDDFSGGTIHIVSSEQVENRGDIDAGQGGRINIRGGCFVNEGQIKPTPTVMIGYLGATIRKFTYFSNQHFQIHNSGHDILGANVDYNGYMVYPEMFDPDGISTGIHFWSILAVKTVDRFNNVGVLSKRVWMDKLNETVGDWPSDAEHSAYFLANEGVGWKAGKIFTVVLDCDCCKVEYFKNEEKMEQCDVIESGKSWYFAMTASALNGESHFRVVDTPFSVLQHY